ncbi:MAG: type III pantothenate kinase [candidate division WOR-3 bacterium]|jgi:type III pantothenate kinase|nr:type III pantothenate kinase [candidate division WOR-3 bacterium]MCR4423473.1 type III pantothenate kinase [candidate division WOR-3 bacterium]MDH7518812.1 type III pantothenate kinase [bacterium]
MILTVLVGNFNTRLVLWEKNRIKMRKIVPTNQVLERLNRLIPNRALQGAALASVVPKVTLRLYQTLCRHTKTLLVTTRTPTPLKIVYRKKSLGVDRLCAAVGGILRYQQNLIIIDFGTAITFNIVHYQEKALLGGPILPNARIMFTALRDHTAQLPMVELHPRENPFVKSTRTAIQAGVFNLILGGIERIIEQIRCRTKAHYQIIATGGEAQIFSKKCQLINKVDPELTSFGLAQIYYFNRRTK